jgi:hypothetical protein
MAAQQAVQHGPKAVEVAARRGLLFAVLLRGGKAGGAEGDGVMGFAWFGVARDAKVDQQEPPVAAAQHDIGRLEVAENNRRLLLVQVGQDLAELLPPV